MKKVNLTIDEIQVASMVGIQRQLEDIAQNKNPTFNEKKELAWQRHIEGALSECALAKYLNVYWNKRNLGVGLFYDKLFLLIVYLLKNKSS